jgi:Domain of unknown function (DUF5666)
MKKNLIITIVAVVVVGAAAFYGGMLYGKSSSGAASPTAAAYRGANGAFRGTTGVANRGAMGQILSVDSQTITVSVAGGGSKLVLYSPDTKISKTVSGGASDLAVGTNIVATGTTNSDGSVSATDIQIRPAGSPFGAPGANGNANRPASGATGQ